MPSLWWQLSVATEDCISPQPSKSSYAIWTSLPRVGQARKKWPQPLFCAILPAVGLLIGRNEAATDYLQDGSFILPDSFASSLDTHATARSPRSSTHSLTSLTHTAILAHTRTLLVTLCLVIATFMLDVHVFSHLLKVRILNMLHSIRPHYLSYIV